MSRRIWQSTERPLPSQILPRRSLGEGDFTIRSTCMQRRRGSRTRGSGVPSCRSSLFSNSLSDMTWQCLSAHIDMKLPPCSGRTFIFFTRQGRQIRGGRRPPVSPRLAFPNTRVVKRFLAISVRAAGLSVDFDFNNPGKLSHENRQPRRSITRICQHIYDRLFSLFVCTNRRHSLAGPIPIHIWHTVQVVSE